MNSEKAFRLYMATRLHFLTDYDVFAQNGKVSWSDKMKDRRDFPLIKSLINKVDSERELIELCVSNFLYGNNNFLYQDTYTLENWSHWKKVKESLTYTLGRDLSTISLWIAEKDSSIQKYMESKLISDLLSKKVEYESIILLNHKINAVDMIQGFDCAKYKVRMYKANKFVNKGTLAHTHSSLIDNFLKSNKNKDT